jgi:predicted NBD/HSP70 family sugar kinase/predicted transcriptional regulator
MANRSASEMRRRNRSSVMLEVLKHGAISRTQIASEIGITGAAVTRITRELIERGILEESDKSSINGNVGRRQTQLTLSGGGPYVIGFAIQAAERLIVLANLSGEILSEVKIPLGIIKNIGRRASDLPALIDYMLDKVGIGIDEVLGIGVAVAGAVDPNQNFVSRSPPLGWTNVPIGKLLSDQFNLPVAVENLNNALSISEHKFGLGQGMRNIMIFRMSYRVGGGFIVEENIVRGDGFGAGQFGHAPVTGADGLCSCGNRGCLNTVASGLAVLSEVQGKEYHVVADGDVVENTRDMLEMLERSERGDTKIQEVLFGAGRKFAATLNTVSIIFRPELVLLAGQMGRNRYFVDGVRHALSKDLRTETLSLEKIEISKMSVAQAAIYLALLRFVYSGSFDINSIKRIDEATTEHLNLNAPALVERYG